MANDYTTIKPASNPDRLANTCTNTVSIPSVVKVCVSRFIRRQTNHSLMSRRCKQAELFPFCGFVCPLKRTEAVSE